ncbi:MAG: alanine racemase [Synergistaceae bacterium]|jgi:predicted amino acid racemase|nr:alanine racemase [Synergistaceae bacterium]
MGFPVMRIDGKKVLDNARRVAELCAGRDIEVWGVTKGLSGDPRLAEIYGRAGFAGISDSRLANLRKIRDSGSELPRQLIRIAMISELPDIPGTADVSLESELSTIRELDAICLHTGARHDVLLAVDVGDLREGFWPSELTRVGGELSRLKHVSITGIATNFACASGVLPSSEKFEDLLIYRDMLQDTLGRELPYISVGGTCCLGLIEEGRVPKGINQLRIGEGVLLGRDTAYQRDIPYLDRTAVVISAEIIECRRKPSAPDGETGCQAFGEKPVFIDRGMRQRALLGIGRQDVDTGRLIPLQDGVHIITASSDHMVTDVTDADSIRAPEAKLRPGNSLDFRPLYPAMLSAATSGYVAVEFE